MRDLIDRQVAFDYVDDVPYIKDHPNVGLLWEAWIEQLPPAQPAPCEFCKHNNIADDKACLMCSAERRTDE